MLYEVITLAASGAVELVTPYQLKAISGADGMLDTVTVADLEGKTRDLEADVLLPFFGLAANLGPISDWGLGMEGHTIAVDSATCATSAPGVFAVGVQFRLFGDPVEHVITSYSIHYTKLYESR